MINGSLYLRPCNGKKIPIAVFSEKPTKHIDVRVRRIDSETVCLLVNQP